MITARSWTSRGRAWTAFRFPISTPGWDIAPYTTLSQYITKDPDTGIQNMGNYRGQVKAPRRLGMNPSLELRPGIYTHWEKLRERGEEAAGAVVLGAPPCVTFTSVQKLPETLDELHVAGGLVGAPINVVQGEDRRSAGAGRSRDRHRGLHQHRISRARGAVRRIARPRQPAGIQRLHGRDRITRRQDAILTSIISQVTPSESSLIKRIGMEPLFLNHLRNTLGIKGVKRVSMHEPLTNIRKVLALVMERDAPATEVWRALYGAAVLHRAAGKYVIAVNEDIDPENADAILWAMSYRANPNLDFQILPHRDQGHGPRSKRNSGQDASVLIDATLKENFPPISLPKREYMERAKMIWEELGLPTLKPESPWFGYSLGEWSPEFDEAAERATRGDYFVTGKELEKRRRKDVKMNTEVRNVRKSKPKSRK